MPLDLADYEAKAREAVKAFWGNRAAAAAKKEELGHIDQGERGKATAGNNMDGFAALAAEIVLANGMNKSHLRVNRGLLTLPGFFRPTKLWDLLVINDDGHLVAGLELKSHVGPSFSNNFNNRTEEAIGTAVDIWTAYREGALGKDAPRPFLGWLMLVEDCPGSRRPVRDTSKHFASFPEFKNSSYLDRYDILCRKLVQERHYSGAALIGSPRSGVSAAPYWRSASSRRPTVTSLGSRRSSLMSPRAAKWSAHSPTRFSARHKRTRTSSRRRTVRRNRTSDQTATGPGRACPVPRKIPSNETNSARFLSRFNELASIAYSARRAMPVGMKITTNTDVKEFSPEQQDVVLAEMQQKALSDFEAAATIADRAHATTAFADAARARDSLMGIIGGRRRAALLEKINSDKSSGPT